MNADFLEKGFISNLFSVVKAHHNIVMRTHVGGFNRE